MPDTPTPDDLQKDLEAIQRFPAIASNTLNRLKDLGPANACSVLASLSVLIDCNAWEALPMMAGLLLNAHDRAKAAGEPDITVMVKRIRDPEDEAIEAVIFTTHMATLDSLHTLLTKLDGVTPHTVRRG